MKIKISKKNTRSKDKSIFEEKLVDKSTNLFKELLYNPNFLKAVDDFRARYHISKKGFSSYSAYEKWQQKFVSATSHLDVVTEEITLDLDGKPHTKSKQIKKHSINSYVFDLFKILHQHKLSVEWLPYLENYVCFNTAQLKVNVHEVLLKRESIEGVVISESILFSFGSTMQVDFIVNKYKNQSLWKNSIEPLQKLMQGYKEKTKRPSRSKAAMQAKMAKMHAHGKTDAEIANAPGIPSMNLFTVRKNISRFKKKIATNG